MKEFIYLKNIGNTAIATNNSGFIKSCYISKNTGELHLFDNYGVSYLVDEKEKGCTCVEILTPTELFWTCLYFSDYMGYSATSDSDLMCDRVAEIVENLENSKAFNKCMGIERLIKWGDENLKVLYELSEETIRVS